MVSVLLFILGVVIFVVGIALSIALHELGHFYPAKKFGVRVSQFMVGFGPTLWSRRRGETEYGVKAIPLGGYISMMGMYPSLGKDLSGKRSRRRGLFNSLIQDARDQNDATMEGHDESRAFYRLGIGKRIIIMLGGPFMNVVIAFVLFSIVLTGFGIPETTTTVASVSQCIKSPEQAAQKCTPSDPITPAVSSGIKPGDTIRSIGDHMISSWAEATAIFRKSPNKPLLMTVVRDGTIRSFTLTPLLAERNTFTSDGQVKRDSASKPVLEKVGFVGIASQTERVQQPLTRSFSYLGESMVRVGHLMVALPAKIVGVAQAAFGPKERDVTGPMSIVGAGRVAGEIAGEARLSVVDKVSGMLGLLAMINVFLCVFNLVPLLPLDGGHVAAALFEGIRRRVARLLKRKDPGPVDVARLVPLTFIVVIVLLAMSALLIYADIVKPITLGG